MLLDHGTGSRNNLVSSLRRDRRREVDTCTTSRGALGNPRSSGRAIGAGHSTLGQSRSSTGDATAVVGRNAPAILTHPDADRLRPGPFGINRPPGQLPARFGVSATPMMLRDLLTSEARFDARFGARPVSGISADSRAVKPGFLFAAVPGTKAD